MRNITKRKTPTIYQSRILAMIARTYLRKTSSSSQKEPLWQVEGYGEISNACAQALIRNGWVKPNRDGLSMFDDTMTYSALVPYRLPSQIAQEIAK